MRTYLICSLLSYFFFNDTATTEIYTLSLHDALPIYAAFDERRRRQFQRQLPRDRGVDELRRLRVARRLDRKSTRLNSSHVEISYAVFCLKKKKDRKKLFQNGLRSRIAFPAISSSDKH